MRSNEQACMADELRGVERRLFSASPVEAEELLAPFLDANAPVEIRAESLCLLALREAHSASSAGLDAAGQHVAAAAALDCSARRVHARMAHARGYIGFKRGSRSIVVWELNRAVELYEDDWVCAQVFDTLGMFYRDLAGDLDRARAYFLASYAMKRGRAGVEDSEDWIGLAITCGNLGVLELRCENAYEAERWIREDLALVLENGRPAFSEAIARVLLADALILSGADKNDEARRELIQALEIAPQHTQPRALALGGLARLAALEGREDEARSRLAEARVLARALSLEELVYELAMTEGLLQQRQARTGTDRAALAARRAFQDARRGFSALNKHLHACNAAVAQADLLVQVGDRAEATRILVETALPDAERSLFGQVQPLARIEAKLAELDRWEGLRVKHRRMLGGVAEAEHTGRLHGVRQRVAVWTCDIRGFTQYCEQTESSHVVEMLNRFFRWIGQPIIDAGGCIDKYIGDNVLAYFREPEQAVGVALATLTRVQDINAQRVHLDEPELGVGIGIATGEVLMGGIGFARKLEHTMIGTPVNRACRLVGEAAGGEVIVDQATRDAVSGVFVCHDRPPLEFKGLGVVPHYQVGARRR